MLGASATVTVSGSRDRLQAFPSGLVFVVVEFLHNRGRKPQMLRAFLSLQNVAQDHDGFRAERLLRSSGDATSERSCESRYVYVTTDLY